MGIFSKKPKVTLGDVSALYADLYKDLIEGTLFDTLDDPHYSEDDRTVIKDEIPFLYTFLLYHYMSDTFSDEEADTILGAFISIIKLTNDANEFKNALNSYSNAWNGAFSRKSQNDDDSPLNNTVYTIAKNATIRGFRTDPPDISNILMFVGFGNAFVEQIVHFRDKFIV